MENYSTGQRYLFLPRPTIPFVPDWITNQSLFNHWHVFIFFSSSMMMRSKWEKANCLLSDHVGKACPRLIQVRLGVLDSIHENHSRMEVEELTDEQQHALSHFRVRHCSFDRIDSMTLHLQEFTHIDSVEKCRQYLAVHEWDVERAIETALISESDSLFGMPEQQQQRTTTDHSPSAPSMPEPFPDELPRPTARRSATNNLHAPTTT